MQLNYQVSDDFFDNDIPKRGYCAVALDSEGVAQRCRHQKNTSPITNGEFLMKYHIGEWNSIQIGAEAYFFQEGEGEKYAEARYGGVKVDENGNSVLIGLYDADRKKIE